MEGHERSWRELMALMIEEPMDYNDIDCTAWLYVLEPHKANSNHGMIWRSFDSVEHRCLVVGC